jgi:hypothetical protein
MRARDERGVALLEAAIVLPVLVIVVLSIFDLGFAWRSGTTTDSATRSGARVASAQYGGAAGAAERAIVVETVRLAVEADLDSLPSQATPSSLWIYRATPSGDPADSSCAVDCIRLAWNGSQFATPSGSWTTADACGDEVDLIGVRVAASHGFLHGLLGTSIGVTRTTTMRLEPISEEECSA